MLEKLLENWLDSASELSYQPVFVQMLAADGYRVLHSTRHCLLEFGKDVLAVDSDGVGCAFQLKGQPNGRMQVGEFRKSIQPQIVQLLAQSPSYPGFPHGPHKSFLVSNGQFAEEVHAAVREMNNSPYPSKLELWSRGVLLDMCRRNSERLWPGEVRDTKTLLELYMLDPTGKPPIALLAALLESILGLTEDVSPFNSAEFMRKAASAAWITGLAIARFAECGNHYAVAIAWTQCTVTLLGAAEKHAAGDTTSIATSLDLAQAATLDALAALWNEVREREHLVEGDPLTDRDIHGWRVSILFGLLTALAVADDQDQVLDSTTREHLHTWLRQGHHRPDVWGEAAVAHLVPWLIWLRKNDATSRPDNEILTLTEIVLRRNQTDGLAPLASPYYDGEAALRSAFGLRHNVLDQPEDFAGRAHTAEVLMHLLVRTNLKQSCKRMWPLFTRIDHHRIEFEQPWHYCLIKIDTAVAETKLYPLTYEWKTLKKDATQAARAMRFPRLLALRPWLLIMWWQAAPHRMDQASVGQLCEQILPGWGS